MQLKNDVIEKKGNMVWISQENVVFSFYSFLLFHHNNRSHCLNFPRFFKFYSLLLHKLLENSYSNIAPPPPPPIYSSVRNVTSTLHNQITLCNNQHHLVPSQSAVPKNVCSAFYTSSAHSNCSNNCEAVKSICSNQQHSSIPHSKSLDHYNEPTKLMEHHNVSRHSFDQPFSSNYKNYDCIDGIHASAAAAAAAATDRTSHYISGMSVYHQPNCSLQNTGNMYNMSGNNRYPLPGTAFPDNHYSQIGNFDREGTCCHQNPHYSRSSMHKSKNGVDYSNCSFQSK